MPDAADTDVEMPAATTTEKTTTETETAAAAEAMADTDVEISAATVTAAAAAAGPFGGDFGVRASVDTFPLPPKRNEERYQERKFRARTNLRNKCYSCKDTEGGGANVFVKETKFNGASCCYFNPYDLNSTNDTSVMYYTLREASLLKELSHPNILRLLDVQTDGDDDPTTDAGARTTTRPRMFRFIYEHLDCSLAEFLDRDKEAPLPMAQVKHLTRQLVDGLAFMHARGILHRALQPQNILLGGTGDGGQLRLKLGNFGHARAMGPPADRTTTTVVICLWYRPPELLLGAKRYSCAVDMWSAGAIFVELLTKKPLFASDSEIDQLYQTFQLLGTPSEEEWSGVTALENFNQSFPAWPRLSLRSKVPREDFDDDGLRFLERCLAYEPKRRISAADAGTHPFLKDALLTTSPAPPAAATAVTAAMGSSPEQEEKEEKEQDEEMAEAAAAVLSGSPEQEQKEEGGGKKEQGQDEEMADEEQPASSAGSSVDVKELKVAELREELAKRGESTAGLKAALAARLAKLLAAEAKQQQAATATTAASPPKDPAASSSSSSSGLATGMEVLDVRSPE